MSSSEGQALLERELSSASSDCLWTLRDLEDHLRQVTDRLEAPQVSKAELAQVVGLLDGLEGQVDAVLTADLNSGKTTAKHYRKALVARVEATRAHAASLYESFEDDWQQVDTPAEQPMAPPKEEEDNSFPIHFVQDDKQSHEPLEKEQASSKQAQLRLEKEQASSKQAQTEHQEKEAAAKQQEAQKTEHQEKEAAAKKQEAQAQQQEKEAAAKQQEAQKTEQLRLRLVALSKEKERLDAEERDIQRTLLRERMLERKRAFRRRCCADRRPSGGVYVLRYDPPILRYPMPLCGFTYAPAAPSFFF